MNTHLNSLLSATETAGFLKAEVAAAVFLEGKVSPMNILKLHFPLSFALKLPISLETRIT